MRNLHIENSYEIWSPTYMKGFILYECKRSYGTENVTEILNRSYTSLYIEWWLHNIGYYITTPFCFIKPIEKLNIRFKDVDLNEWK